MNNKLRKSKTNIYAIIPARSGSKRIPNKNIKLFVGRPIISYSIKAAQNTNLFDKIIVSTDSQEIARVSKEFGAEVPFIRPANLADDYTGTDAVILHGLYWLINRGVKIEYICCIYPAAPLIQSEYIRIAYKLLKKNNAVSAFSVTTYAYPIFRALKIDNNRVKMIWPKNFHARSQDLLECYHDAGQFYWANVEKYLEEKRFFSSDAIPIILPRYLVQDIDTQEDWEVAERIFRTNQAKKLLK